MLLLPSAISLMNDVVGILVNVLAQCGRPRKSGKTYQWMWKTVSGVDLLTTASNFWLQLE